MSSVTERKARGAPGAHTKMVCRLVVPHSALRTALPIALVMTYSDFP